MTPAKFQKSLLIMISICSVILIAGTVLSWLKLKESGKSVYEKEVFLDNFTNKIYSLNNLKRSFGAVSNDEKDILFTIPKEKTTDRLMSDLDALSKKHSLNLTIFKYVDLSGKKTKVTGGGDPKSMQTVKKEGYLEVPFEVAVTGSYPNIYAFVLDMEKSKRLISLTNINIEKIDGPSAKTEDEVKLTSNIKVYIKE